VIEPILLRLRSAFGRKLSIVHTHTSPSVQSWPHRWIADRTDYLPLPNRLEEVCRAIHPSLVLYPRGELWPHLVRAADAVGASQAIVAGQIRNNSLRTRWPTRGLMAKMVKKIALTTVRTAHEAEGWRSLGVDPTNLIVTGDPRDDYVLEHRTNVSGVNPLVAWRDGRCALIAGSTHPADERCLIQAMADHPEWEATVIAPHETNSRRIQELLNAARRYIDAKVWYGMGPVPKCRMLIVSCQGLLQDLYAVADIAYVGGGFDPLGIHSIAEAAAFALPILVGPRGRDSAECQRFIANSAATVVCDARQLAAVYHRWKEQPTIRARVGLSARHALSTGASSRTMPYLMGMLARR